MVGYCRGSWGGHTPPRRGQPRSRVFGSSLSRGNVQGVPVAVEAERDTGADEGHLLPVALANKTSHADRQAGSEERRSPRGLGRRGKGPAPSSHAGQGEHPATSSCLSTGYPLSSGVLHINSLLYPHRLPEARPWSWRPLMVPTSLTESRTLGLSGDLPRAPVQPISNETCLFLKYQLHPPLRFLEILPDPLILASTPLLQTC